MFESLKYAVLGLGDTNYDKFCHMGKSIDKRVQELGGQRILPLCCADEATGLEETVEKWKLDIREVIKGLTGPRENEIPNMDRIVSDKEIDVSDIVTKPEPIATENMIQTSLPEDIMNFDDICKWLDIIDQVRSAPPASDLPRVKVLSSSLVYPAPPGITVKPNIFPNEWNAEHPYSSTVMSASYISFDETASSWEDVRKVIKVELSLGESGIVYEPGDTIGVCCPNPDFHVNVVYQRLRQYYPSSELTLQSEVLDTYSNTVNTLDDILRYRYHYITLLTNLCTKFLSLDMISQGLRRKQLCLICANIALILAKLSFCNGFAVNQQLDNNYGNISSSCSA